MQTLAATLGKRALNDYFYKQNDAKLGFNPQYCAPGRSAARSATLSSEDVAGHQDAALETEERPAKKKKIATFENMVAEASLHSLLDASPPDLHPQAAESLKKIIAPGINPVKMQVFASILEHSARAWAHQPAGTPKLLILDISEGQFRWVRAYGDELPPCKPKSVFLAYHTARNRFRLVHQAEILRLQGYGAGNVFLSLMNPTCQGGALSRGTTLPFAVAMLAACSAQPHPV
jgi:hypothetical protein